MTATRVTRVGSATTRTRGPVASVSGSGDALSLEVAGIPIIARDDVTEFEDADGERLDAAAFRTRAEDGAIVKATGPDNDGRIDTARTLRLIERWRHLGPAAARRRVARRPESAGPAIDDRPAIPPRTRAHQSAGSDNRRCAGTPAGPRSAAPRHRPLHVPPLPATRVARRTHSTYAIPSTACAA